MSHINVFPDAGGWSVRRGNSIAAISTHGRKEDAMAFASELARSENAEVLVLEDTGQNNTAVPR